MTRTYPQQPSQQRSLITGHVVRIGRASLRIQPRAILVTGILTAFTIGLAAVSLMLGRVVVPPGEFVPALFGVAENSVNTTVVQEIRLPRIVAALSAGAAFGVSGAVFQSVSRNALGSPDIIGLTTGAATGALTAIIVFQADPFGVMLAALSGGIGTAVVIYLLARKGGITGGFRLVLIGIGVGALLSAVNSLLIVRGDLDRAFTANIWLAGSVDDIKWHQALPTLAVAAVMIPLVGLLSERVVLLEMGDDLARQLGVPSEQTRRVVMLLAVVLAGVATSAVGPIAFIALAAPQLARRLTGITALPVAAAAAMGACLLMAATLVTTAAPTTVNLPIGQVTGLIGGLYLAWLLTRSKQL